jgi:hypothetical protein
MPPQRWPLQAMRLHRLTAKASTFTGLKIPHAGPSTQRPRLHRDRLLRRQRAPAFAPCSLPELAAVSTARRAGAGP